MEHGPLYPPVSHKIQGPPYLCLRYFRDSHACYPTTQNILGSGACMNWRSQGSLPPAFPGKESSSIPPFPITIAAPVERSQSYLLTNFVLESFTTTAVAPLERVKLLMQSQNMMIKSGQLSQPYKGILNCFTRTIRNEGFFALWRGNTANLISLCSMEALNLALTSSYMSYFSYMKDKSNTTSAFLLSVRFLIVGAAARILLIYPLLYAETRLANDIKSARNFGGRQFNGMIDLYKKTLKSDGIRGLYRGCNIAMVEDFAFVTIERFLHLTLKPWFNSYQTNFLPEGTLGWGTATFARLATYPMDTVSRRMMMSSMEAIQYRNTLDAFSQILRKEGVRSFYKGAGTKILLSAARFSLIRAIIHQVSSPIPAKKGTDDGGRAASTVITLRRSDGKDKRHGSDSS